jgi:hypothetical protein
MELDDVILEFCLWIMAARELEDESPQLRAEFPDIVELVDWMQGEAKKIIRSARSREGVL